ncbi:MAG: hypothetical protein LBE58_12130, partial [Comamonas sp.]|nr:hypothetical protein [Comamonas sp.]
AAVNGQQNTHALTPSTRGEGSNTGATTNAGLWPGKTRFPVPATRFTGLNHVYQLIDSSSNAH